jgi:hypothetical protein
MSSHISPSTDNFTAILTSPLENGCILTFGNVFVIPFATILPCLSKDLQMPHASCPGACLPIPFQLPHASCPGACLPIPFTPILPRLPLKYLQVLSTPSGLGTSLSIPFTPSLQRPLLDFKVLVPSGLGTGGLVPVTSVLPARAHLRNFQLSSSSTPTHEHDVCCSFPSQLHLFSLAHCRASQ